MRFTRRRFMAGVAATTAVVVTTAIHAWHQDRERKEAAKLTPDEASLTLPETTESHLGNRLRGSWRFRVVDAVLPGLTGECELLLDVAAAGRSIRGVLRIPDGKTFQVLGDLSSSQQTRVRWRLAEDGRPAAYECTALLDEVWGAWASDGSSASLSGRLAWLDEPMRTPLKFLAVKQPFPEARERIPLQPQTLAWLVSPGHRLFHQLWHASRDKWDDLDDDKRNALRGLGWQPGPLGQERDARGKAKHRNGSGVDFLFMHRHMLMAARRLQPLPSWTSLPLPRQYIGYGLEDFAAKTVNHDGYAVPPAWEAPEDEEFNKWLLDIKSNEAFHANFQMWEAQYQDPEYLAKLKLGEFGSQLELGMHDWLHMRWAAVTRDPSNGMPVIFDRDPVDFSPRWFRAENDYLGDPFSSHVNPVFWSFHGWIDDRLEDWFRAHERAHPGEVVRHEVNGVPWFAPGKWVEVDEPWLGPTSHGCGQWLHDAEMTTVETDIETMKLAIRIAFSADQDVPDLLKRAPRRPFYARSLGRTV
ncbi:PvdJ/PvdD/PvdP-like protein [Pseudomonas resinovorans]|uniref:pyoverdine maturation tyrosinase PvdP n=1 Tax=Metapseudomonas resinovorans TaxID=53412 RepID=UPI00237F169D|nr:PvdJ/PvdD/PvdP-like protein [Pseudomonas resinovorans]MDE3735130.1 PvdJ/PvdD/PvdP-like protein [Pseudomonas resinovorans]